MELRKLRAEAGSPSYRELSRRAHFSVTALSEAAGGQVAPTLSVLLAYAKACGGDPEEWTERWQLLMAELAEESLSEKRSDDGSTADLGEPPYLGLATFEAGDAERFFGRERLVAELCERIADDPFLALFAPSGAGKSSLLRAGLIPAMTKGAVSGGEDWVTVLLTPGADPVGELAIHLANQVNAAAAPLRDSLVVDPGSVGLTVRQILAGKPSSARLMLVVDQFEEVFTLCQQEEQRVLFVELLLAATREPRARIVLGARADFYARCAAYPELVAALRDRQVLVGPMDDQELRSAITGPARLVGLKVESALLEAAVADVGNQPGALPLLSHALLETWRQRRGDTLTAAGYHAAGGVSGAIAQTAERVYGEFDADQRRLARDVFLRMTAFGEGTEDTRRRVAPAELLTGLVGSAVAEVLERLTNARLVTADEDSVTIAHEALIQGWPRLRGWLADDREMLRSHRRLTEAATEWEQHGRGDDFLYRGTRLAAWEGRDLDRLNALERQFLDESRRRAARETGAARRRVRVAIGALAAAVVVVGILASVALVQASRADSERDLALSRQLAAEARSQLDRDPRDALSIARQAYAAWSTVDAEMVLRQATVDTRQIAAVPTGASSALGAAISPDGQRVAAAGSDGAVRVWRFSSEHLVQGNATVVGRHDGQAWNPAFSPDSRLVATAGVDGTVRVHRTDGSGQPLILRGHTGPAWRVHFHPDGRRLASVGDDGTVRVWDVSGGEPLVLRAHEGTTTAVVFSPDGRKLASTGHDRTIRVWDLASGSAPTVLRGHEDLIKALAFSPDGLLLGSGAFDGLARVWQVDGTGAPVVLRGHQGTIEAVAFSPDGRRLVTTSDDATARVWSTRGDNDPQVLRGHVRAVWGAAFSPDGSRLVTSGDDGTLRLWNPTGPGDPLLLPGHEGGVWATAYAPDGTAVASGGADGVVRIWDPDGRAAPVTLRGHSAEVLGVSFSPDGRHVVSAGRDGTIRVWGREGRSDPQVLRGHDGPVWVAQVSPDGRSLASVGKDGTLRIWDLTGQRDPVVRRADADQARYLDFSPDGRTIATGGADGTVRIWDSAGGGEPRVLTGHEGLVWAVSFSPDGRWIASAGTDGTVRIWAVAEDREPLVLRGHQGFVWYVVFSRDGRWVASTGKDATVRIWRTDIAAAPVTYRGFGASVEQIAFAPDGVRLALGHDDGTLRLWRCDACRPIETMLSGADGAGGGR